MACCVFKEGGIKEGKDHEPLTPLNLELLFLLQGWGRTSSFGVLGGGGEITHIGAQQNSQHRVVFRKQYFLPPVPAFVSKAKCRERNCG